MGSNDGKTVHESQPPSGSAPVNLFGLDSALRLLLLAASIAGVVVMVTSKQTELVPNPLLRVLVSMDAKFDHSPAFM